MAGNGSRLGKPVKIGSLMPSILENLLTREYYSSYPQVDDKEVEKAFLYLSYF